MLNNRPGGGVVDAPSEFGLVSSACISQHEWYVNLRGAGFSRHEALYIITRPSVEITRLEWTSSRDTGPAE
jgi:hypothetical protein